MNIKQRKVSLVFVWILGFYVLNSSNITLTKWIITKERKQLFLKQCKKS